MADADGNVYGPFDVTVDGSEAEPFTEEAWFRMHDESGVVSGGGLTFSGLTAQLAPIFAWSHGAWLYREATWSEASPPTTGAQPRRDMLVIRREVTLGEGVGAVPGRCVPLVLNGTPAASPADPAYDAETDTPLWSWQVPASGGTVVTGIVDHRVYVDEAGRPLSVTTPHRVLHGSGTVEIPAAAWTAVTLGVNARGSGMGVTLGSGRINATTSGLYFVTGAVAYPTGTTVGRRHMAGVMVNGTLNGLTQNRSDPAQANTLPIATAGYPLYLNAGDYIQLATRQDTSTAQTLDRSQCFLSAFRIST